MRLSIIFISAVLITGQVAWAETLREALKETYPKPSEQSNAVKTVAGVLADVFNDYVTIKPSMVPPEIFDKIYSVEKRNQAIMDFQKGKLVYGQKEAYEAGFNLGSTLAVTDLLYIVGILPSLESFNIFDLRTRFVYMPTSQSDRMRIITAMFLLLNYKEANPIPPGDIVQVTITK